MSVNVRRSLAVQLVPVGGSNPLKMRISNNAGFVVSTAGTTAALIAQGGVPAYAYSITSGSLPTGLSLSGSTGIISGTPSAAGTFAFTAQVQDSALTVYNATFSIRVAHILAPINLPITDVDFGGVTINTQLQVSGATGTVTWSATSPPSYVTVSSAGVVAVNSLTAPSGGATVNFNVTATDSGTGDVITYPITFTVYPFYTFTGSAFAAAINTPIGATTIFDLVTPLGLSGGKPPYSFKLVSYLGTPPPSWVSVNPATGFITLTPPTGTTPALLNIKVFVTDTLAQVAIQPVVTFSLVNPNQTIQLQQGGSSAGIGAGYSTKNYGGGAFVVSNTGGAFSTATVTLPAATNSVPGYMTASDHALLASAGASWSSFGSTPNSAGASLTGGVLTLQPANASFPGGLLASDWVAFNKNVGQLNFTNTTVPGGNTLANTITTTKLASQPTLPASVAVGSRIRIRAAGVYSTTGSPTFNWQMLLGATQLTGTGFVAAPTTVTNLPFVYELTLIVISNTSVEISGELHIANAATTELTYRFNTTSAMTVASVNSGVVALQFSWGTASVSNTVTMRQMICEVLAP